MQMKVSQLGFYKAALAKNDCLVSQANRLRHFDQVVWWSYQPSLAYNEPDLVDPANRNACRAYQCTCALKGGTTGGLEGGGCRILQWVSPVLHMRSSKPLMGLRLIF